MLIIMQLSSFNVTMFPFCLDVKCVCGGRALSKWFYTKLHSVLDRSILYNKVLLLVEECNFLYR